MGSLVLDTLRKGFPPATGRGVLGEMLENLTSLENYVRVHFMHFQKFAVSVTTESSESSLRGPAKNFVLVFV